MNTIELAIIIVVHTANVQNIGGALKVFERAELDERERLVECRHTGHMRARLSSEPTRDLSPMSKSFPCGRAKKDSMFCPSDGLPIAL